MALLKFKRSAVSGKAPALGDLELGELAINTFDGKVYMRKDNGTASIIEVGGGSGVLSFNSRTGAVTLSSSDVTTALGYTPANKAGDTFTGAVNFPGGSKVAANGDVYARRDNGTTGVYYFADGGEKYLYWDGGQYLFGGSLNAASYQFYGVNNVRAPIFYDSNNTGYYVDPASGSYLSSATFDNLITGRSSPSTDVNTANDVGSISIRGSTTTVASMSFHRTGAYAINMGLGTDNVFRIGGWSAQSNCLQVYGSGVVQALNDFRAPIFYDSDNTAFYVDPATNTRLGGTLLVGPTGAGAYTRFGSGAGDTTYATVASSNGNLHIDSQAGYDLYLNWYTARPVWSEGGAYFPIYYDRNDSAYYVNPNGSTSLRTVGDWRSNSGDWTGEFSGKIQYHANNWYLQGANEWNFRRADAQHAFSVTQAGICIALGDMRAPIFYDNNNTAYYVDPHSTTNINVLNVAGGNVVKGDSSQGRSTNSGNMNSLADPSGFYYAMAPTGAPNAEWYNWMNCMGDSWGGTDRYGFQIAHQFWNPNEFYVRRVQSGGWQPWERIFTTASNDVRAPIFYDSNDTGYYLNPNATSRMSSIALGGAAGVYQGVFWAAGDLWVDGNGRKIAFTTDGSTDNGGNVSIFAVGNDFRVNNWSGSALNDNFYVFGASRDAACAGNITAYYSDDRLKTKTGTIADALAKVASLEGFTYVENETARAVGYANDRQQVGVSAQSIQAVLPEAVHLAPFDYDVAEDGTITSKSGEDYLTVDYSRIVPLLIEAIKELNNKVETLEASIRSK